MNRKIQDGSMVTYAGNLRKANQLIDHASPRTGTALNTTQVLGKWIHGPSLNPEAWLSTATPVLRSYRLTMRQTFPSCKIFVVCHFGRLLDGGYPMPLFHAAHHQCQFTNPDPIPTASQCSFTAIYTTVSPYLELSGPCLP